MENEPKISFSVFPDLFGSGQLHFILKTDGTIIKMSSRWSFFYSSVADRLSSKGNLKEYFDFPEPPPEPGRTVILRSRKEIVDLEIPEPVYTSFSTFTLVLHHCEPGLYYGVVRFTGITPNFYLQRPNGIVYIDEDDRLVGFNHTFFRFFQDLSKTPDRMLNKPSGQFMEPSIARLHEDRLALAGAPDSSAMRKLFDLDSSARAKIACSRDAVMHDTGEGLVLANPLGTDFAVFTLPSILQPNRDFIMEMDFIPLSGLPPLFYLDRLSEKAATFGGSDYSLGPDVPGRYYQLKRRGIVQRACPAQPQSGRVSWRFCRAGRNLIFFEQGGRRLFFHDPNDLHEDGARVSVALRDRSSVRVESLRVFQAERAPAIPALPVIRLRVPQANAFLVNPMDNIALSTGYPNIHCYVLENATELQTRVLRLKQENRRILAASGVRPDTFLGKSPAFSKLKETAAKVALSDVTVLLEGETGTGKEALARFIHEESPRSGNPFIKVDCATIPATLIESELFGHEKGAFTGAVERREGLLEQAGTGTLFLDEIGNLTREVQAKLLQFLQDRAITRVGGRKNVPLDVRIIAASNTPLQDLIKKGAFRPDLYYRMEVVSITIPPLRERREDIPELCRHFIRVFNAQHERNVKDLSAGAYERLFAHSWPGNVRELRNTVERAVIFCGGEFIPPELITQSPPAPGGGRMGRRGARPLKRMDEAALRALFQKHQGVALRVARELGVAAPSLYEKIVKLGLTVEALRKPPPFPLSP